MGLGGENGINGHQGDTGSESEDAGGSVGFSGPLSGPLGTKKASNKRNARFKDEQSYVEITLDVRDDSVAIQDIQSQDQEASLLAKALERRSPSINITSKLKQVSQELRRMASFSKKPAGIDRTKSGATRALKGLQFVTKNVGSDGWPEIERRFNELAVDGVLLRSRFGQCIGMDGSDEFAIEVYDALARRRGITAAVLTKGELREFWEQLSDQSFDSRLQTFFDMVDKDADGRITEAEVKEIISLSASANGLSKIQERADEYTALIMEELDPNHLGYVEVYPSPNHDSCLTICY